MNRKANKWLIAAASLVAIGGIMFAVVMTVYRWDFSRLSTRQYETNTYEISEGFRDIRMNLGTVDVLLDVSDDNACRVVCYEDVKMKHSVEVQDGTLIVSAVDDRAWYEYIGIDFHSPEVTVYLPKGEYDSLDISVSTGDLTMMNVSCQELFSTGSTGDVLLKNVIAAGKISIERSTGDVVLDSSDSAEIYVETDTGDVSGSLLSGKVFVTETSTGDISVPNSAEGGKCEIITSTGDIFME